MAKGKTERGRFSARKKMETVLRVLRGEELDLVSREAGITAATLSEWRDHFLTSGQAGLKSRATDGCDEELARLKALVGDLTMTRTIARGRPASPRWRPFGFQETDAMSHATSPSGMRPYGVVRVCQEWGLSRSTFYHQQSRDIHPRASVKRRPKTAYTDRELTGHIRTVITIAPFLGEGHRKVWARLRAQRIRTSKRRVLRLMRQAGHTVGCEGSQRSPRTPSHTFEAFL